MTNASELDPPAPKEDLRRHRDELAHAWGIDFLRVRRVACLLAHGRHTTSGLVQATATSHRAVRDLLRRLDPWLEHDGATVGVRADSVSALREAFGCDRLALPALADSDAGGGELAWMARLLRELPPPVLALDHISATPATAVRRADFITGTFDLDGASVLCLGDHDLTSLALLQRRPDLDVVVVDIDDRILAYISEVAARLGWRVRTVFADLRVELPRSLHERFDLVFTDPPYTPVGIELFLRRALESLRQTEFSRVLFCYGFSERQPALGLKVQGVLQDLRLVAEAVLPAFNRYVGAEAIGSASAMYVCRPTRRTWRALASSADGDPRIYTHGELAEEASLQPLPTPTLGAVRRRIGGRLGDDVTIVGDGWPPELTGDRDVLSLTRYLRDLYVQQGKPPFTKPRHAGTVLVSLYPHTGAYLVRVLLTAAARRLIVVAPRDAVLAAGQSDPTDPLARLVACEYQAELAVQGSAAQPAILAAAQTPPPAGDPVDEVLRYLVDHRHATLGSAWREGLVARFAQAGRKVTKNQARRATAAGPLAAQLQSYLSELPLDALRALVADVGRSLERVEHEVAAEAERRSVMPG